MPLEGELKWAALIARQEPFDVLLRNVLYVGIRFTSGRNEDFTPFEDVSTFRLPKKVVDMPLETNGNILVWLVLRRPILGTPNFDEVRYKLRWKHSRFKTENAWRHVFVPKIELVSVRFPALPRVLKQMSKRARASYVRTPVGYVFLPIDPTRPLTLISQVARSFLPSRNGRVQRSASLSFQPPNDRDSVVESLPFANEFYRNNPTSSTLYTDVVETRRLLRSRSNTPNFFSIPKSELPVNPFTLEDKKLNTGYAFQHITAVNESPPKTETFKVAATSTLVAPPSATLSFSSVAYNRAIKGISRKTKSDISNIAVTLVQWKQLDSLINGNVRKIISSVNAVRKFQFSRASDILFSGRPSRFRRPPSRTRSLASNWLEFQYGWKPLLSDIEGALEAFALKARAQDQIISVRAVGSHEESLSTPIYTPIFGSYATVTPKRISNIRIERKHRCIIGLRYKLTDVDRAFIQQLGFTNPLLLTWELIPFSFVVDWFVPIGSYLEGISSFQGLEFVDGFQTRSVREKALCSFSSSDTLGTGAQTIQLVVKGGFEQERFKLSRTKLTSFPQREPPSFQSPFTFTRSLNALALLRVAFRD